MKDVPNASAGPRAGRPPADPPSARPHTWYMRVEPGAVLPPDVPADAQRYRRTDDDAHRDRTRIAAGVCVAMMAAGVGLAMVGAPWMAVAAPIALAVGVVTWAQREPPPRWVPNATGDCIEATRGMVAESLGARAAPQPLSLGARLLCGVLGIAFIMVIALPARPGELAEEDATGIAALLLAFALGVGLTYLAVRGELPTFGGAEIAASPWFYTLADPSRPLPDDAPVSGGRPLQHASQVSDDPTLPQAGKRASAE